MLLSSGQPTGKVLRRSEVTANLKDNQFNQDHDFINFILLQNPHNLSVSEFINRDRLHKSCILLNIKFRMEVDIPASLLKGKKIHII